MFTYTVCFWWVWCGLCGYRAGSRVCGNRVHDTHQSKDRGSHPKKENGIVRKPRQGRATLVLVENVFDER